MKKYLEGIRTSFRFKISLIIILSLILGFTIGFYTSIQIYGQALINKGSITLNPNGVSPTPPKSSESSINTISDSSWKHVQYKDMGFAIDYPASWEKPKINFQQTNTSVQFGPINDYRFSVTYGDFYDSRERKLLTYDELIKQYSVYHKVTDVTLAGKRGKKFVSQSTSDPGGVEYVFPGIYVFKYNLPQADEASGNQIKDIENVFEKMLQSVYFADKNGDVNPIDPLTGWHIFQADNYSFKYPGNWTHLYGTSCSSFGPTSNEYTFYICYYPVGYPYNADTFLEDKLNILSKGEAEVSRDTAIIDGKKATKQLTLSTINGSTNYDIFYFIPSKSNTGSGNDDKIFEIEIVGIDTNKLKSTQTQIDQILETFKLNF